MSEAVYIYAIGCPDGPVKIGVSASPQGRLNDLQVACPYKIDLLHMRQCRNRRHAMSHERLIHKIYSDHRLIGEWFEIDEEIAIEAIDTSIDTEAYFDSEYGQRVW